MLLRDILQFKGNHVHTIAPQRSLSDVTKEMVRFNCGALVVCDENGNLVGIISERDILKACALLDAPLAEATVESRMTKAIITAGPDDTLERAMGLMTERRVRHLPVLEQGALVGMVSIGDLVKAQYQQLSVENHYLKTYIQS